MYSVLDVFIFTGPHSTLFDTLKLHSCARALFSFELLLVQDCIKQIFEFGEKMNSTETVHEYDTTEYIYNNGRIH